MSKMDYSEFLQRRDIWESDKNRLMTREEVAQFDAFFADKEESAQYQSEGFIRAQVGDFSQFEAVEPMMKGYLGAKKCYALYNRYNGDLSNPLLQQEIKDRLMEADLRAGFALGGNDPENPIHEFLKNCERMANRQMLIQTLEEPDPTAKLRLLDQFQQENPETAQQHLNNALNEDLEKRVEIAKILFMNHLGKFQVRDGQLQPMEMQENIAEVYAHGGRTMFILPAGANQKPVMDGIQGQHPEQSGLKNRSFATHGVTPRTIQKDGSIASEASERRVGALAAYSPSHHKGMNAAVGGLGHVGPNGKVITADGTNGHMYMHLVPGKENTCGMMLVGFENSGPGKKGRLGHAHTASAKKAGGSAFLSDKRYLGKEIGGRTVDLSGVSGEELAALLSAFEKGYRNAATAAQEGNTALLDACNDLLTGKQMSVGQMKGFLQGLQIPQEQLDLVGLAKAGHAGASGYAPIVSEENPTIPMQIAQEPAKRLFRVTQCEGLVRPKPPAVMKKPTFWDKVMHQLTLHSKNSYISRYKAYQETLPEKMDDYRKDMQEYHSTLEALERGEDPKGLKAAYDRAVKRAEETFGTKTAISKESVTSKIEVSSLSSIEQLENKLLDTLLAEQGSADIKTQLLNQIRQTESYKKLLRYGDNISTVLSSPEKMENVLADVSAEIVQKNGHSEVQKDQQPQKEMQEPQIHAPSIGGMK